MRRRESHRIMQLKREVTNVNKTSPATIKIPKRQKNLTLAQKVWRNTCTQAYVAVEKVNIRISAQMTNYD